MGDIDIAFVPKITDTGVREYFERKGVLGIFKPGERIENIERRYAPLGVFNVTRVEEIKEGVLFNITKNLEKNNNFYVNLSNADLYYVSKGIFRRNKRIKTLDIIKRIVDLPLESVAILSDIMRHGEISHEDLNRGHFLFLDRNFDNILILQTRDLIEIKYRIFHPVLLGYLNNIDMPSFDDNGYNLKEFLCVDSVNRDYKIDPIIHSPNQISEILGVFFGGNATPKDIIYIPYDRCRYMDNKNRFRCEIAVLPKFK